MSPREPAEIDADLVALCACAMPAMTDWEGSFVTSLSGRGRRLSLRQREALEKLGAKAARCIGQGR